MMKFCADISPLDIECSLLDIHYLFCQTPTTLPACAGHLSAPACASGAGKCGAHRQAAGSGGGLGIDAGSTALCCVVTLNAATAPNADFGGVYCEGLIRASLITRNRAYDLAGGLFVGVAGVAENCTISSNSAGGAYGGVRYDGLLRNAIVYDSSAPVAPNVAPIGSNAVCQFTCTLPLQSGDGNITNDPGFVNRALGDYHLGTDSPCINTGTNLPWMLTASDLDGNPRSIGGFVDMGCYETLPEPACALVLLLGCAGLFRPV